MPAIPSRHLLRICVFASALVLGALQLAAPPAQACGGFFCSQVPVDQSGEDIVFTYDALSGGVTATIRIFFTGNAEDFAWVVPVASPPELDIAPLELFTQLRSRTEPRFYLNWSESNGECSPYWGLDEDAAFDGVPSNSGGVEVVEAQEVGPYNVVTLKSDDPEALYKWLNDNGFDQPEDALPLIEHYVSLDMFFVAMKLKNGASVSEIQPIELSFENSDPCVPLILTRVAAMPDMPIRIFMLGHARAVPTNWLHVVLNLKKIDWVNNGSNYMDVITQAIDEASGRAFVTEFAGTLESMDQALWSEGRFDLEALKVLSNPAKFVQAMLAQGFPRNAMVQEIMREHIPMPQSLIDQGLEERDFYNNLDAYQDTFAAMDFDPIAMVKDLEERVVAPLKKAQEKLNANPYITRLFATVSPEEMTRDPFFDFNPDLPEVSNIHEANATAICGEGTTVDEIIVTLPDGGVFTYVGPFENNWSIEVGDAVPTEPAAKRVELLGTSGLGQEINPENVEQADRDLDTLTPEAVLENLKDSFVPPSVDEPKQVSSGFGCAGASSALPLAFFLALAALGGLMVMRRRES